MDKLTQWVALTVVGVLAVLAAGWFLLVSPKRADADALRVQAQQQLSANSTLETQLAVLKAQAKDLPRQQAKLAAVAAKIPATRAMPALIRALTKAADDANVELVSLTPSPTVAAAALTGAAATPVAPAAAPSASAAGATTSAPVLPTALGPEQLSSVPVVLNVVGGYYQLEAFLNDLESLPRALRVSNLAMTAGSNPLKPNAAVSVESGRVLNASITGQVFLAGGLTTTATVPVAPVVPSATAAK